MNTALRMKMALAKEDFKYQSSSTEGTFSLPVKSRMAARGSLNGRRNLEGGMPIDFWALQLIFDKQVLDLSTPSMREEDVG